MKINHIAFYVHDLEKMCNFYQIYLGAKIEHEYRNEEEGFTTCFLIFSEGTYIELIQPDTMLKDHDVLKCFGLTHVGFALDKFDDVDRLALRLEQNKYKKIDGPRYARSGFYAARFLDPEDNIIEITAPKKQ